MYNDKIKKVMPILLAVFTIMICLLIVGKHELHLKNSQPIFIKLRPVDPRSILQGDYMALRYQLHIKGNSEITRGSDISEEQQAQREALNDFIHNKHKILAYVALDDKRDNKRIVTSTNLQSSDNQHTQPLMIKNPNNYLDGLYVSSKTFLFAEGLADCYQRAKYAKIQVDDKGNAILASLVGEDLKELGCES